MAIQFDCPYCTATMKVPDSTMGTIGRCPKCETRVRVPVIEIPTPARSSASVEAITASFPEQADSESNLPDFAKAVAPRTDKHAEFNPFLPVEEHHETATIAATVSSDQPALVALRKPKRPDRTWIWVAAIFAVAACGIGFGFWWQSQVDLDLAIDGQLMAEASVAGFVAERDYPLDPTEWANILSYLKQHSTDLRSDQMDVRLESETRGIKVSLKPGKDRELVAVPLLDLPEVAGVLHEQLESLEASRHHGIEGALQRLSKRVQEATATGNSANLSEFGITLGVNGLIGPLGYHTHAVIGRNAYPCVFEDRDGRLYYLVPPGAESFIVQPKASDGEAGLPRELSVRVTVSRAT